MQTDRIIDQATIGQPLRYIEEVEEARVSPLLEQAQQMQNARHLRSSSLHQSPLLTLVPQTPARKSTPERSTSRMDLLRSARALRK